MMMSNVKPESNAKAQAFVKKMAALMSKNNTDGLGYTALDAEGKMFGQRWHDNDDAFKPTLKEVKVNVPFLKEATYQGTSKVKSATNSFGTVDLNKMVSITLHTRFATSGRQFENTHPFVDHEADTSLIHNGVIRNVGDFKFKLSTCDSEAILITYLRNQVGVATESVQSMANELTGYYACGVYSRDVNNNRILDIFKGNGASLHCAFVYELGVWVFSTAAYDIREACESLKYSHSQLFEVQDGYLIRINPLTGEFIKYEGFIPGKETTYQSSSCNTGGYQSWNRRQAQADAEDAAWTNEATTKPLPEPVNETKANIIDATKTTRQHEPVRGGMSKGMIEYLMLAPSIKVLRGEELIKFAMNNYLFGESGKAI